MPTPIQITARGISLGDWWKDKIFRKAKKLTEYNNRISHCRVVAEVPHKHRHKGRQYSIRIDLHVPGGVVIVDHEPSPTLNEAIDRAFQAADRKIEERLRIRRRLVKHHETVPVATVSELFPDAGFGFLETSEGRRLYFHRNSVLHDGFAHLTQGSVVRFAEEEGQKGPQASSVTVIHLAERPVPRKKWRALRGS